MLMILHYWHLLSPHWNRWARYVNNWANNLTLPSTHIKPLKHSLWKRQYRENPPTLYMYGKARLWVKTGPDGGPHSSFKQQRKGHPAGSGPKSERAPQHDKIALLPFSFLTHTPPHPIPTLPPPSPSLPPPTTSIPIPSSAYRASRSTCSPQWHHPVAEAAGGARVWGTTSSRRNHLTRSGRWLTRVMSRQLLLHVVCIYFVHDRDRPVTSGKVKWQPWKSGDNRESLVTPWEKVPWWQGLWMWVSPPSLQLKSLWLRLWATKNALRVAVAGRENIPPKDLRMKTRPWMRLQRTAAAEETVLSSLKDASNQHANASSNAILFWKISRMMGSRTRITTSVPEPIAAPAQPGAFPSKVRIQWPRGNQSSAWARLDQELSTTLTMRLKGSTAKQLSAFCEIVHSLCLEKFGEEVKRKKSDGLKQPNRRQVKKGQLRARQRQLKRQLKDAPQQEKIGIQVLLDDIKQEIWVLSRAENHRKRRKKQRKTRESFYRNPYAFAKKLFTAAKSGRLDIPQQELEDHLRKTYSDPLKEVPLPPMDGIPPLEEPETPFRAGGLRLYEAREFIRKARACSAPGLNGISFKLYKNCPTVLEQLVCLLQRAWREGYVAQEWCLADGVWIPKEENSIGVGSFRPISLLNVEGKIFFGVIARRMTSFLLQNKYINTSVQKAGIPGFPGCLEHAQMIWNSLMTAKREKKELHVVWLDLANAYGSVPHNCIRFALKFFHIPEKVAAILMQYSGNVFMRFTTTDYTTGWQALEVGIMMGCVVSPLLFVMCMELILRGTTDTASGEETRSGDALPPSRAFMDDVTTLVQSKVGTQELLDRYPRTLHMGTNEGQAKEEPKYFPCPWDHLWHPFLHRWQHHPHSPGTASQEPRQAICLPTHRQTQRSRGTEDCPGGPSRYWEEWASWKAQGMVLPAWSLTPSPVAPAGLRDFPLQGWNYPTAHQQVPPQVVGCAPLLLNSWPLYRNRKAPAPLLVHHRRVQGWKS